MDQNLPVAPLRDALIDFVRSEQLAQFRESDAQKLFSPNALVSLGYALKDLTITQSGKSWLVMRCRENYSRLRPGDSLRLACGTQQFSAILTDTADNGRALTFRTKADVGPLSAGPWLVTANTTDLSNLLIAALEKLQPGAPGWSYFRMLAGETSYFLPPVSKPADTASSYERLVANCQVTLDPSQQSVFKDCLQLPPLLQVQGPPGTGKTQVLACVIEAIMRMGLRVMVVAPTHQAVNNALSTIARLFPDRPLVKVGDDLRRESLMDSIPTRLISEKSNADIPVDTVLGMTFSAALQHLVNRRHLLPPHVLVIDEAGQLPLAQGACAGLVGARSVLLFGDDMQMPPIFAADMAEEPLAVSIFGWLRQKQPTLMRMLQTSHRMNSELCQAIGQTFYARDGISQIQASAASAAQTLDPDYANMVEPVWLSEVLNPAASLVWVSVPGTTCMQFNQAEAAIVAEIAAACLNNGLAASHLAVVTPFRRQVMLIRHLLDQVLQPGVTRPLVDTVERAQGLTVDVVIVSMCASEPNYAAAVSGFLFSPNRFNVSLSRARCKAIVLSSPDVFRALPADYRILEARNLLRQFLASAQIVHIEN